MYVLLALFFKLINFKYFMDCVLSPSRSLGGVRDLDRSVVCGLWSGPAAGPHSDHRSDAGVSDALVAQPVPGTRCPAVCPAVCLCGGQIRGGLVSALM